MSQISEGSKTPSTGDIVRTNSGSLYELLDKAEDEGEVVGVLKHASDGRAYQNETEIRSRDEFHKVRKSQIT
eukprot:UN14048